MPQQSSEKYVRKTSKRPYKKSTTGCTSCKTRKIKCDELRPLCSPCQKRYVGLTHCTYESKSLNSGGARNLEPSIHASGPITLRPRGITKSNLLELRLMHHFTETTRRHNSPMTSIPVPFGMLWELDIPQTAFTSELVMNALFALSALDLACRIPDNTMLSLASRAYFVKTIEQHRRAITRTDQQEPIPLLISAVLIAHFTWLSSHLDAANSTHYPGLDTFRMCQGIIALTENTPELSRYKYYRTAAQFCQDYRVQHTKFLKAALDDLEQLRTGMHAINLSTEAIDIYNVAEQEVKLLYHFIAEGNAPVMLIEQTIITFLHRVPHKFSEYLRDNQPYALAIWLRNIVLFELLESSQSWWVHGSGTCNVPQQAVSAISKLLPADANWVMNWPLKVISKDVRLDESMVTVPDGTNGNTAIYKFVRDDPMRMFNTEQAV